MQYKLKKGLTLWLTGMSGAGKSTIAEALYKEISENLITEKDGNLPIEILDGDEVRQHISKDLKYTREDRLTNIERIAFIAGKISKHGVLTIVPVIAPYEEARSKAKSLSENYMEIFVKAELETLIQRDVKGLYKKALNNEIENFTGISDPYEEPANPDILINTEELNVEESIEKIVNKLSQEGFIEVNKIAAASV